jgi:hypothetical protein
MQFAKGKTHRRPLTRNLWAAACGALLLLGTVPAFAPAESSVFESSTDASIEFVRGTAALLGPEALVPVRCNGPQDATCTGVLTLSVAGQKHKAPYSILGGTSQDVSVTVGGGDQLAGRRAVAVARTTQSSGRFSRSSEVLHFR